MFVLNIRINPLFSENPYTSTLANSEEPDEMHLIRACTVCFNQPPGTEIRYDLDILLSDITKWAIPYLLYQYVLEKFIRNKKIL